jgi:hypothetical protein
MRIASALALGVLAGAPLGCANLDLGVDTPKERPFELQINVVSDPGVPLAGAQVMSGTKVLGKTDASGSAAVRLGGKEDDAVELTAKCPENYESPKEPLTVSLRRLAPGSRPPQFEIRCPPTLRTIVVGVRTENGPDLPVVYLGRTVARTDASGAALFVLRVKPFEQIEVTVSTAEKASENLRPKSPTLTFVAHEYDDFIVLDQSFTIEKPRVHYRPKPDNRPKPL